MNQMKYFPLWTTLLEKLRLKSPYTYDTILLLKSRSIRLNLCPLFLHKSKMSFSVLQ